MFFQVQDPNEEFSINVVTYLAYYSSGNGNWEECDLNLGYRSSHNYMNPKLSMTYANLFFVGSLVVNWCEWSR